MMQTLIRKNRYMHCYKGFVIHYRPKTAAHRVARYEVFCGDQSFGLFDGKAQAICYIDQLYQMQRLGKRPMEDVCQITVNPAMIVST